MRRLHHAYAFNRSGGDSQAEMTSLARLGLHQCYIAPQHFGQAFTDCQPQARAAESPGGRGLGLGELLEQILRFLG